MVIGIFEMTGNLRIVADLQLFRSILVLNLAMSIRDRLGFLHFRPL